MKFDRSTAVKNRLSAEESLSLWMKEFGEGTEVELEFGKKLFRYYFRLRVKAPSYNPYNNREVAENYGMSANGILVRVGLIPEFAYENGENVLTFHLKSKPKNQILVLSSIILFSLAVGLGGKALLPAEVITAVSDGFVTPIEDTFFNILSAIAGPMIFLSVAWGIYGIGDVYTLGKIGKKMMNAYIKTIFVFVLIGTCFYPLLGPALSASSSGTSQLSNVFQMILSIFPANIFSPFIEGNTLQIIFFGIIIGFSLIVLGQRTSSVARVVEEINHIINYLMEFVSKLVPYFVFILLVKIVWSDSFGAFTEVWKFSLVFLLASLVCCNAFLLYVCIKHRQHPWKMLKTILPSFLIAITTASSSATFESNVKICDKKFGIHSELSSFGIPFGMVIFKPNSALYYLLICFYFANINGVSVSVDWIITAIIITVISAIATPPIPGGAAATYTILFAQLGIGAESLALVIAIDMIFDFWLTSGDMSMLLLQMYHLSGKMGMRDESVKI